jgi:hypothetical protein
MSMKPNPYGVIFYTAESLIQLPQDRPPTIAERVAAKLLELGGDSVVGVPQGMCEGLSPDRYRLFEQARRMRRGRPCRCHFNSARIWATDPSRYRIVTGFGLSDDGIWRRHSWVVTTDVLYETTVKRVLYYGVELNEEEAVKLFLVTDREENYYHLRRGVSAAMIALLTKYSHLWQSSSPQTSQ